MKRFYKEVAVVEAENGGHEIHLDGKPIKTPSQRNLTVRHKTIAQAIAKEWEGIEEDISQDLLPITQLQNTIDDYVADNRPDIEREVLKYLETDMLVYHTPEPEELAKLQAEKWGAVLEDFFVETGTRFEPTTGFDVTEIPKKDFDKAKDFIAQLDDTRFTVFQCSVAVTGSYILAYMLIERKLNAIEVFDLCQLEEEFYLNHYDLKKHGPDPMQDKKAKALSRELGALETFLSLI